MILENIDDDALRDLAIQILVELQKRECERLENGVKDGFLISFTQDTRHGVIVRREDGKPADRDGWLYLPFLREVSSLFQPPRTAEGAACYRELFRQGEILLITRPAAEERRIRINGWEQEIKVDGASIGGKINIF